MFGDVWNDLKVFLYLIWMFWNFIWVLICEVFENWGLRIEFWGIVNLVLSGVIGVFVFKEKIGCVCENFYWCYGKLRRGF